MGFACVYSRFSVVKPAACLFRAHQFSAMAFARWRTFTLCIGGFHKRKSPPEGGLWMCILVVDFGCGGRI